MRQCIRLVVAGAVAAAALGVLASSAMAWSNTNYPGTDPLEATGFTVTYYAGSTPVYFFTCDADLDATLNPVDVPNLGDLNTGTVDAVSFSGCSNSSGLRLTTSANNLPWSITDDPAGGGGVIVDIDYHVDVENAGGPPVFGTYDAAGAVTGSYSSGTLSFSAAPGLVVYSATGIMAGLNGLSGQLSGNFVSTASPAPTLD